MDWALWNPSDNQVAHESISHTGYGWQCDFYFGYGIDVIEENALNEKVCVQVLRILLTKADSEIVELEEDLLILQTQLAWAHGEWSDMCSAALRERIDCLDISIQSLKNKNVQDEYDFGACLPMHREPAERMHEILKSLLNNYSHKKDEQYAVPIIKESSSDRTEHVTDILVERKRLSNSTSNTVENEKVQEPAITPRENNDILNSSLKPSGEKTNYPLSVKCTNTIVKGSSPFFSTPAATTTNEKEILMNRDSKRTTKLEANKRGLPTENGVTQRSSLKPRLKRRNLQTPPKPAVRNLSAEKHANSLSLEEMKSTNSGLKTGCEEVAEMTCISSAAIPNLPLRPEKKRVDMEEEKPEDNNIQDSSLHALRPAADNSCEKNDVSKFNSGVSGKQGVRKQNSVRANRRKAPNSSLKGAGKETNLQKMFKRTYFKAKDSRSNASGLAAGLYGRKKLSKIDPEVISKEEARNNVCMDRCKVSESPLELRRKATSIAETVNKFTDTTQDSGSDVIRQAAEDSDANPKQSEGPPPAPNKIAISNLPFKKERKTVKTPHSVKDQKASLTPTEHTATGSLLQLLSHRREDATRPQPKKMQTPRLNLVQKAEISSTDGDSNSNLPLKPQKQRLKRKHQERIQEPCLAVEIGLKSSSVAKSKRGRNCEINDGNGSFNWLLNKKMKKETQSDLCGAKEPGIALDVSTNSGSQLRKKKKSSNLSAPEGTRERKGLEISFKEMHNDMMGSTNEEDPRITKSSSDDSDIDTLKLLPCPTLSYQTPSILDVEFLTLVDLKAIAKQHKLKGYYKLPKAELAEQLGLMVQVRGRKKKKGKEPAPVPIKKGELQILQK